MRNVILFLSIGLALNIKAQSNVKVYPQAFDFGTVKKWKNDTATFIIENTGPSKFIFLPVGYSEDLIVLLPKESVNTGQAATVKLIYFTQNRGNFRKSIPVYINTYGEPIELTIKGKIIDFHPDAMLNCPSLIDNPPPATADKPVEIQVIDAISGRGISGFDMIVKNPSESQLYEKVSKDRIYLDNLRNGKYLLDVSLTGYESKTEEIVINRVTRKFIIKLRPDDVPVAMVPKEEIKKTDEPLILEKSKDAEEEKRDIEKIREKYNEIFKDKKIIEKDVIVVKEGERDSAKTDTAVVEKTTMPDFTASGTLNKNKYADNNIVFLIDVSGSMDKPDKLPYLKRAVKDMVKVLRTEDLVTLIIYSNKAKTILNAEPGSNKNTIYLAIDSLKAKGLSHGTEGVNIAYEMAKQNFIPGGNNQIILVSDGLFNSDDFSPKKLYKLSKQKAESENIKTSAIGFGKDPEAIEFLRTLSINGSGNFIRILSENDAATALVYEIMQNSRKQ